MWGRGAWLSLVKTDAWVKTQLPLMYYTLMVKTVLIVWLKLTSTVKPNNNNNNNNPE